MGHAAKPIRHNRTLTVDFHDEAGFDHCAGHLQSPRKTSGIRHRALICGELLVGWLRGNGWPTPCARPDGELGEVGMLPEELEGMCLA
jgi:hypothetical protein